MRKRIRKKLNIGEFRETGFEITWKPQEVSEADFDKFIQEFLDAIEARGLVFGGGCSIRGFLGRDHCQKKTVFQSGCRGHGICFRLVQVQNRHQGVYRGP